ncbi:MAG: hypothetical protein J5510_08145 [Prevotella sp.]|nr:hypothetical protein [Prevotella sp.]
MGCSGSGGANGCGGLMLQQGDAFSFVFQYKEEGEATTLPTGYDLIVGMYNMAGTLVKSAKLSASEITLLSDGTYQMSVSHSDSMNMVGGVTMEITIKNADGSIVDHASNVLTFNFEPRRNNSLLETQNDNHE